MSVLRRFAGGALLLLVATFGLSQQTVIITGPRELTGPLTIRVIPPAPAPPPSAPVITTPTPLPDGDINEPYSINLAAAGGTLLYSWYLAATETLPQDMEEWTPVGGELAFVETFGDPDCSATDNTWPTSAGLVIDNTGKLSGNCSGRVDGADSAVIENGIAASNAWISRELRYTTLPTSVATLMQVRSATNAQLCRLQYDAASGFLKIWNSGGTLLDVFQPANDTRYKIGLYAERGVIAANAKCHARVATWNGSSWNAPGTWVESNDGTWTALIDNVLVFRNHAGGVWYTDTYQRCQAGPVGDGACSGSGPDLYQTPSPVPNNVYVDGTVPISEALWSHNGTDLTLEIATDPDASTIQVAEKPGGTLTLSQSGVLSGTPTASGTLNFTARVCDAVASCSTKAFSLDINEPPDPTPPGPWVAPFPTPLRTHYVSASGSGNGTIGSPESLSAANGHDACGDLHILRGGTYTFTSLLGSNTWGPSPNCTSGSPAVWRCYVDPATGQPERCTTNGSIRPTGAHQWFVNIEATLTTPDQLASMNIRGPNMKIINGVVHDTDRSSNILGSDQAITVYGTSLWRPGANTDPALLAPSHNIYTNGDCAGGMKYIVHNISQEGVPENTSSRNLFQANDSHGDVGVSCFHLEGNFFGDSPNTRARVIWANGADPGTNITITDNWFVDFYDGNTGSSLLLGLLGRARRPGTYVVTDNYFYKANAFIENYWGNSGAHDPIAFTGNEIYDPPNGLHVRIATQGLTGDNGTHKIFNADTWDGNTYGGTFNGKPWCNGTDHGNSTLAQWRTRTDACRVTPGSAGFDLTSTNPANPTVDKVRVIKNQYECPACPFQDGAWGWVHCANIDGNGTCSADISSVVGVGKTYTVKYSRDPYGTAAAAGTCPGSGACNVSLPTRRTSAEATGKRANAYLIWGQP